MGEYSTAEQQARNEFEIAKAHGNTDGQRSAQKRLDALGVDPKVKAAEARRDASAEPDRVPRQPDDKAGESRLSPDTPPAGRSSRQTKESKA